MKTVFKLTDQDGFTRRGIPGETAWLPIGRRVFPKGEPTSARRYSACAPGVLHFYASPVEAVLFNPAHAAIETPRLFRVEATNRAHFRSDGCKLWTRSPVRTVEELPLPTISDELLVAWAIVRFPSSPTRQWAIDWLSGRNRSQRSAGIAWRDAREAPKLRHWSEDRPASGVADAVTSGLARGVLAEKIADVAASAAWSGPHSVRAHGLTLAAFDRAQQILAGTYIAHDYDSPLDPDGKAVPAVLRKERKAP